MAHASTSPGPSWVLDTIVAGPAADTVYRVFESCDLSDEITCRRGAFPGHSTIHASVGAPKLLHGKGSIKHAQLLKIAENAPRVARFRR